MSAERRDYSGQLTQHVTFTSRLARQLLRDMGAADDVSQDALLAALERERSMPAGGSILAQPARSRSWLAGVVRNLSKNTRRAQATRRWVETSAARDRARRGADEPELRLELGQRVAAAVLELDEAYRVAVLGRFLDGASYDEIARQSGVSPAAARKRVSRGIAQLRRRLEDEFGGGQAGDGSSKASGGLRPALLVLAAAEPGPSRGLLVPALAAVFGLAAIVTLALRGGPEPGPETLDPLGPAIVEQASDRSPSLQEERGEQAGRAEVEAPSLAAAAGAEAKRQRALTIVGPPNDGALAGARSIQFLRDANGETQLAPWTVADGDGRVALHPEAVAVGGFAAGRLAAWAPLPAEGEAGWEAEPKLSLAPAAAWSGRVLVDGVPGAAPDFLRLERTLAPRRFAACPVDLLDALQAELGSPAFEQGQVPGEFSVDGLGAEDGLRALPLDLCLIENAQPATRVSPHSASLNVASGPVLLELRRNVALRGRVVWDSSGEPVTRGLVEVAVLFADGTKSYRSNPELGTDGTYEAYVFPYANVYGRPQLHGIRVVAHPAGGTPKEVLFAGVQVGPDGRLPDLPVVRVPDVFLSVTDPAGDPVPGAILAGDLHRDYGVYRRHVEADEDGRGVLRGVPGDLSHVVVMASPYRIQRVPLGSGRGSEDSPIQVRLEAAPSVRFLVPGADPDEVRVLVVAPPPLLRMEREGWTERLSRLADIAGLGGYYPAEPERSVGPDEHGVWRIYDFLPGVSARVDLLGGRGRLLDSKSFVTPHGTAELVVELDANRPRRPFAGAVLDPDGQPVAEAQVNLQWEDGRAEYLGQTGPRGGFEGSLDVEGDLPISIVVRASGFVREEHAWPGEEEPGQLAPIRLRASRGVQVELVDPDGKLLPARAVVATDGQGRRYQGQSIDRKGWLAGLPPEELTLEARLGGRTYRASVGADQASVRMAVPRHGTLRAPMGLVGPSYTPDGPPPLRVVLESDPEVSVSIAADAPGERLLAPGLYRLDGTTQTFVIRAGETTVLPR